MTVSYHLIPEGTVNNWAGSSELIALGSLLGIRVR
jgi:hypothetical protein